MALTVQTNNAAMTALKNLNTNSANMNDSLNRLSSGFRINNAADDASGFAVSSKLDAQSSRLKAASQNATQATAMVKMADAGINEIQNMVSRVQVLATQAASANNAGELTKLDAERVKLEAQIDKIANSTNYNGVNLLNGVDANSALVAGTAATLAGATLSTAGVSTVGLVSSGTATFVEAATFSVTQNTAGLITSITADVALTAAADGTAIGGAAGSNLITAQTAVGAISIGGMTFTSAVAGSGTPAAPLVSTTAAATAGTASTAAGASDYAAALAFQVGADNNANNQVSVDLTAKYTTTALGLGTGDLLTQAAAQTYIDTAKTALNTLITQRADLGATQNQLNFVQANLATSIEQSTAAVSSIRDADMAAEMANFTKNQILTQAGTSMLAQANQAAQNVLSLFR